MSLFHTYPTSPKPLAIISVIISKLVRNAVFPMSEVLDWTALVLSEVIILLLLAHSLALYK